MCFLFLLLVFFSSVFFLFIVCLFLTDFLELICLFVCLCLIVCFFSLSLIALLFFSLRVISLFARTWVFGDQWYETMTPKTSFKYSMVSPISLKIKRCSLLVCVVKISAYILVCQWQCSIVCFCRPAFVEPDFWPNWPFTLITILLESKLWLFVKNNSENFWSCILN